MSNARRPIWRPDTDLAFVVAVADREWFFRTIGKAVHAGRVSVVYAVEDHERRGLRPDLKLTHAELYEDPLGW